MKREQRFHHNGKASFIVVMQEADTSGGFYLGGETPTEEQILPKSHMTTYK